MQEPQEDDEAKFRTQFYWWYPYFVRVTMKSVVLDLPESFVDYLLEDGVVLPSRCSAALGDDQLSDDESAGIGGCVDVDDDGSVPLPASREFPELDAQIERAIADLGGEVFPKLNWSCPLDSSWMNGGTLKCLRLSDVYVLLKSSERLVFDVEHMLAGSGRVKNRPERPVLVLRKWANLQPSMEFRMFVYKGELVGICQRDCTAYFSCLQDEAFMDRIGNLLGVFFVQELKDRTMNQVLLPSYAADVYVDRLDRVWLVDINVLGQPTDPLLFAWTEITVLPIDGGRADSCCEIRVVDHPSSVLPSERTASQGPIDVTLAPDFPRFLQEVAKQRAETETPP